MAKKKRDYEPISTGVFRESHSFYTTVRNKRYGPYKTAEEAQAKREELKTQQAPKPAGGEFADFVRKQYYPHYLEKMRVNTQRVLRWKIENVLLPYFEGKKMGGIERLDVMEFRQSMLDNGYATTTTNTTIGQTKAIFTAAKELGLIGANPAEGIKKLREPRREDRHMLAEEEILDVVRKADHPYKYAIALIGLAGCRPEEVMGFRWEDFALGDKPTVAFRRSVNVKGDIDELKSDTSFAVELPIVPALRDLLLEWKAICPDKEWLFQGATRSYIQKLRRSNGRRSGDLIFDYHMKPRQTTYENSPPGKIQAWWKVERKHQGLEDVTPYDFRRSFATNAVKRFTNPKVAQKLCRHANIQMTLDVYARVRPEQMEEIWDWSF